jgi:hypothetical protein
MKIQVIFSRGVFQKNFVHHFEPDGFFNSCGFFRLDVSKDPELHALTQNACKRRKPEIGDQILRYNPPQVGGVGSAELSDHTDIMFPRGKEPFASH